MSRTRLLIWILALVVLLQMFPERAGRIEAFAVVAAVSYLAAWVIPKLLARQKEKRQRIALEQADEEEYRQYLHELEGIRMRYDPQRDVDEPTSISQEYEDAIAELHNRHEAMLRRKFRPRS